MLGGLGHSTEQQLCKQVEVVSITESCVDVEAAPEHGSERPVVT